MLNLVYKPLICCGRKIFDFLLPNRCLSCSALNSQPHSLCPECWKKLNFISVPCCPGCSFPFEFNITSGTLCASCIANPPLYNKARSALVYDEGCRSMLLRFKHGDATFLGPLFAKWLVIAGRDLIEEADYIVPVPLHWKRLFQRQYNQAAILALSIGKATGKKAAVNILQRHRATLPQGHKKAPDRKKNVAGAFRINPGDKKIIQGKNILLVDDVMTTGATLQSCTASLLAAGASRVNVLTVAKAL